MSPRKIKWNEIRRILQNILSEDNPVIHDNTELRKKSAIEMNK